MPTTTRNIATRRPVVAAQGRRRGGGGGGGGTDNVDEEAVPAAAATSASTTSPIVARARTAFASMRQTASNAIASLSPRRAIQQAIVGTVVGTSPFEGSTVASSITSPTESNAIEYDGETNEQIIAGFNHDMREFVQGRSDNYEGDSGDEGEEVDDHFDATSFNADAEQQRERVDCNDVDVNEDGEEYTNTAIDGAPEGWSPPSAPDDFKGYEPKHDAPPSFADVDNPGGWSQYTFQATYKNQKYEGCETPCKAKVVPANAEGKRVVNNWNFFYNGWEPDAFDKDTYVRGNAKRGDIKSDDRMGKLDVDVLKKHGMTADKVKKSPL